VSLPIFARSWFTNGMEWQGFLTCAGMTSAQLLRGCILAGIQTCSETSILSTGEFLLLVSYSTLLIRGINRTWQPENSEDLPRGRDSSSYHFPLTTIFAASTHHLRLNYKQTTTQINPSEVWILLTRHLRDTRKTSEYIALNVQEDDTILGDFEHVALNVRIQPFTLPAF
jgi:hypothetical protein